MQKMSTTDFWRGKQIPAEMKAEQNCSQMKAHDREDEQYEDVDENDHHSMTSAEQCIIYWVPCI